MARFLAIALLIAAFLGLGCGYRLMGTGPALLLLDLGPVDDRSTQPLFGSQLRAALAREVANRPETRLAAAADRPSVLTVRMVSVTETVGAFVVGDQPRAYTLRAEAEATVTGPDGKVRWKGLKIRREREFAAGTTVDQTQDNKESALAFLAGDLSREILARASLALEGGEP